MSKQETETKPIKIRVVTFLDYEKIIKKHVHSWGSMVTIGPPGGRYWDRKFEVLSNDIPAQIELSNLPYHRAVDVEIIIAKRASANSDPKIGYVKVHDKFVGTLLLTDAQIEKKFYSRKLPVV